MAKLQSGVSPFSTGQVLSANDLNNHVTGASPLPDFIAQQTELTTPAIGDELLINDIDGSAVKKITLGNLALGLPATRVSELQVQTNAAVTGNLTVGGTTTLGDSASDTATVNAAATFGAAATFSGATTLNGAISVNNDATLGQAAVTGPYTRVTTTITVTKVAHGLTTGNSRWFVIQNNTALSGTYSVTVTGTDTFTITVTDSGATSGTISWYERTTTVQSTLAGSIQGEIAANLKTVEQGSSDEFLLKDTSDSNKLRTTQGSIIKAWANISADYATISGSLTRSGSTTATITTGVAHNLRVNDVLYLTAVGTFAAGWYSVATVTNSTTFTVATASSSAASGTVSWFRHNLRAGTNVYSAYGRNTVRVIHVNFTNKPPSADDYIVTLSAVKFTSNSNLLPPQVNNIVGYVPSDIMKTVNGFAFVSYDTGGIVTDTSGEFHVQSIW